MFTDYDVGFLCGLAYVELWRRNSLALEPLAAPVLRGQRYADKPIYFSDVIVRRDSSLHSFADLRGCSWAFNERFSQSGYGITRYYLARLGERNSYFSKIVESGSHQASIRLVCSGAVHASAIDSQLLAVTLRDQRELAGQLRIIASLGPSIIQPVVASRHIPESTRSELRAALLEMEKDPTARKMLSAAFVKRWVPVNAASYDHIRRMRDFVESAGLPHWDEPSRERPHPILSRHG
jgi:phosphonate transport system substrate-binding protein